MILRRRGIGISTILIVALFIWFMRSPGTVGDKVMKMTDDVKQLSYTILKKTGSFMGKDFTVESMEEENSGNGKGNKETDSGSDAATEDIIRKYTDKLTKNGELQKIIQDMPEMIGSSSAEKTK